MLNRRLSLANGQLCKKKKYQLFFALCFNCYIDPGGRNSHPGGLGGDSGGEKHEKIELFIKLIFF